MINISAAIELGTTVTRLAVGESEAGGRLKVTAVGAIPSTGVRKCQILNRHDVAQSVHMALEAAEKYARDHDDSVSIGNAVLVVNGPHVAVNAFTSCVQTENGTVTKADIDEVKAEASDGPIGNDRELLDMVEQAYTLDDQVGGVRNPLGMTGRVLKLNVILVHADKNRLNDARNACNDAKLEVTDPVLAVDCAADATLDNYDKANGTLVIDFGGGATGYAVYAGGGLITANVIGVGGNHVTNDIAQAFQTTGSQAEELKLAEASAMLAGDYAGRERVKLPGKSVLTESRTIPRRALDTVVNARLKELIAIIRQDLSDQGVLEMLHAGVVLVGGGARMRNLDALVESELGLSVRIGRPQFVDGVEGLPDPCAWASLVGALMYANNNVEEKSIWQSIFGLGRK